MTTKRVRCVVATALVTWLVFAGTGVARQVALRVPRGALFVGSYVKVPVKIDPTSGLTMKDLDFMVAGGTKGGTISRSQEDGASGSEPDVTLLVGYEPGEYVLRAVEKNTGAVLGESTFAVTTLWADDRKGPSLWVSGELDLSGIPGAAWGGGSATEPDNYKTNPAIGVHQVAILLVDTNSQRFTPQEAQAANTLWKEVAFDGTTINGKTVSTAHYYREVSDNKFDFKGEVFGPVSLSGEWNDYMQDDGNYKGNLWQACATAGDPLIDYSKFQHLVCVIRSVDATGTTQRKAVWPHADAMIAKTAEGDVSLGTVDMPADGAHFALSATLAHELGHNLGLGDIYPWGGHPPKIQARHLDGWALMANHSQLPHMVLVHRMKLGWISKEQLKLYNFHAIGGFVDENVTLHPVAAGMPPTGQYSGIEIRIAPGIDYYYEYRTAQKNQIGDQALPTNDRVLGCDVMFIGDFEAAARRKPVMLLPNDTDGDGPVLGKGQDYREQDVSEPNFPTDFSAEVTDIDGTKANMRIKYGVYSHPDPSIRPWSPPVYQSPDIEVRNQRNQADPKWFNVPWENNHNTLVAKVMNRGNMDAPGVWVDFYIKDYTVNNSGTPGIKIDSVQQDVPAMQTVEFSTIWMPAKAGHYCIEARIRHYQTPGTNSVMETTEYNNRAQSNYDRFMSSTASAPSREVASVKVHNPFDAPTMAFLRIARSSNPLFRTYLEHTWLKLEPHETQNIQLMFEYTYEKDPLWIPILEQYRNKPNNISVAAFIQMPEGDQEEVPVALGGVTAQVVTGRATHFKRFVFDPPIASGEIVAVDNGDPVSGGKAILIARTGKEVEYRSTDVSTNGRFQMKTPEKWQSIQAYYVPAEGYADTQSDLISQP